MLFTLWHWHSIESGKENFDGNILYGSLAKARKNLALFQHHDAISGTARSDVINDYANKILAGIKICQQIINNATNFFMNTNSQNIQYEYKSEEYFINKSPKSLVASSREKSLIILNALPYSREKILCIIVDSFDTIVLYEDEPEKVVPQQLNPVFNLNDETIKAELNRYELCFLINEPPLGYKRYKLERKANVSHKSTILSSKPIELSNFNHNVLNSDSKIIMSNEFITAKFCSITGYLKTIQAAQSVEHNVSLEFVQYDLEAPELNTDGSIFMPVGSAKPIENQENEIIFIDGPLKKSLFVKGPKKVRLVLNINLDINSPSLRIKNMIDLSSGKNLAVAMRLKTSIHSGDVFYTELNGYQMIKRRRFSKLPIQAQIYPMSDSAFIEDINTRLSLIGPQVLGVTSLESGWLEVLLEKRSNEPDANNNNITQSEFRLLIETLSGSKTPRDFTATIGYHSLLGHHTSLSIHYPSMVMFSDADQNQRNLLSFVTNPFPCNLHFMGFRSLSNTLDQKSVEETPQKAAALILHRLGVECSSTKAVKCEANLDNKISVRDLFTLIPKSVQNSSLTLLYTHNEVEDLKLEPMEIKTVKISF